MATYRYLFYDLLSGMPNVELPLFGTYFNTQLNKAGNSTFSMQLDAEGFSNVDTLEGTMPGRTAIYVERNGAIKWGGIVWSRTWQEQSKTLQYSAQTFESWLYAQFIESTLTYSDIDQRNIVRALIDSLQSKTAADIGIVVPSSFATDIVRDVSFKDYEGWTYGKAVEHLLSFNQSFDYNIRTAWGPGDVPQKILRIDNVLGTSVENTQAVFDFPGNIKNYWYPENASRAAVSVLGFGKGEGESMIRSKHTNVLSIAQGYPDIQQAYDNKDVGTVDELASHVESTSNLWKPPITTPTLDLNPQLDVFGFELGDYAKVNLQSSRFPNGYEADVRIIGYELRPPSEGREETFKLIIAGEQEVEI